MIAVDARPSPSRRAKFERVLAKLVLDRPVFTRGQSISVYLDSPLDELCDVTFRLTHKSGRTYAEARVQLDSETLSVALGMALNLPDGEYDIIATPPLAEFFSTTPVERRLPCRVAASPYFDMTTGTYAERRTETLQEIAARGPAPTARLAQLALEGSATPALLLQLLDGVNRSAAGIVSVAGAYLESGQSQRDVEAQLVRLGTRGIDFSSPAIEATIVALAALIEGARHGQVADLSAVAMDKLVFCLAMNCTRGVYGSAGPAPAVSARVEPLSGVTRLLWGVGGCSGSFAAPLALTLAESYEVPPLLHAIAFDEAEGTSMQRHAVDGDTVTFNSWRCGASMLSSSNRSWLASLGPDARIFAATEAETMVHREAALAARYAEAAAGMLSIAFPLWAFEESAVASHWACGRMGDNYIALHATNGLDRAREHRASALLSPAAANLLVCHLGTAVADGTFEAFQARIATLAVSVSDAGFVVETLRDAPLTEAAGNRSFAVNAHLRSAYCTSDAGDTTMEIRFGAEGMRMDFSLPDEPHDGDQK